MMPALLKLKPVYTPQAWPLTRDQNLGAVCGYGETLPGYIRAIAEERLALIASISLEPSCDTSC